MRSLALKRVLITGAGQGIGRALAERFAAERAEVVLTDINETALATTREALTAAGGRCRAYPLDVTDPASIAATRDALREDSGGSIDILVNNAGVVFGGPFLEVPLAKHQMTYKVNVEGTVAMTHAFLPDLLDAPEAQLVFIASASGFVGLPNGTTYASSKWATIGFAESIRQELKHQGHRHVGVTTVCPSYVSTGLFDGAKPPKSTEMLTPEDLADKVIAAVKAGDIWVLEPWIVKLTPALTSLLPTSVSDFIADALGATSSMDAWHGHQGPGR